jgi:hypothetical protein
MTVEGLLNGYTKEVIIKWITNRYPVFMNKNIKEELEETKKDLEFDKIEKELQTLFAKQKRIIRKTFSCETELKIEANREKIHFLLGKQQKLLEE